MLAAIVIAAICLRSKPKAACLPEDVLVDVGAQLLDRVVTDTRDLEQGAFLIRDAGGNLSCELWPLTTERSASTFYGAIPDNTIAILHTHPHEWIYPSEGDGLLSLRLALPVVVITRGWISAVDPAGSVRRWRRDSEPPPVSLVCHTRVRRQIAGGPA